MSKSEYEKIIYPDMNFSISMFHGFGCSLHHHREIELCILLDGKFHIMLPDRQISAVPGDIWIINPWISHKTRSESPDKPALAINIQISPVFFSAYFPQMEGTEFPFQIFNKNNLGTQSYEKIAALMQEAATNYFQKQEYYELNCAGQINLLFAELLNTLPHRILSSKEWLTEMNRVTKVRKLSGYIEENYNRKLLLSEIAEREGYSMSYLSHFFKEAFGISFQKYLTAIRCEKARQLLLSTNLPLLDICISCGFSDPKYFNKGFQSIFGCSPKEYRQLFS